jgi:DNA repair protein RadC
MTEGQEGKRLSINQWAEEDRPREKMMTKGAEALTNAELLAILIGSGTPKESAVELMKRVLEQCKNNLNTLGKMTEKELCRFNGIGPAKAITILAACELGKRRAACAPQERPQITSPDDIYGYFLPLMQDLRVEECHVLLMNNASRVIGRELIGKGGYTETTVDIRLVMKHALESSASTIALCHNHPSGNTRPSRSDEQLTERVKEACKLLNIRFLDHVIVADGGFYSFSDAGKI